MVLSDVRNWNPFEFRGDSVELFWTLCGGHRMRERAVFTSDFSRFLFIYFFFSPPFARLRAAFRHRFFRKWLLASTVSLRPRHVMQTRRSDGKSLILVARFSSSQLVTRWRRRSLCASSLSRSIAVVIIPTRTFGVRFFPNRRQKFALPPLHGAGSRGALESGPKWRFSRASRNSVCILFFISLVCEIVNVIFTARKAILLLSFREKHIFPARDDITA